MQLDLVYFEAGGGHRSAALALTEVIRRQRRPWRTRLVNLQEILDPIDVCRRTTGVRFQDLYNLSLRIGWTLGSEQTLAAMHGLIRVSHTAQVRLLQDFWISRRPDLVVSLVPHFNRALYESLENAISRTPMVTILTDLADSPPHFWLEPQNQHFICGSARAVEQASEIGIPEEHVRRTSGMIVHPRFYESFDFDRRSERAKLGLDPDRPTAMVMFGGQGSAQMTEIAERVAGANAAQLILMCGRNERLMEELQRSRFPVPVLVKGFTDEVPYYMRLADLFIGKPGPGSVSEALAMRLPVIVERSPRTLVQERYNVDWLEEQGVGCAVPDFRFVAESVKNLLRAEVYGPCVKAIERLDNRAVFEIPGILEEIVSTTSITGAELCATRT